MPSFSSFRKQAEKISSSSVAALSTSGNPFARANDEVHTQNNPQAGNRVEPFSPPSSSLSSTPQLQTETAIAGQQDARSGPPIIPTSTPVWNSDGNIPLTQSVPEPREEKARESFEPPPQPSQPSLESKSSGFLPWGKKVVKTQSKTQPSKEGDSQFKIKVPESIRGLANLSQLEIDLSGGDVSIVSDNKKRQRKEGLCTACSSIDFEQFDSRNTSANGNQTSKFTHKLVFLDRILRKKKNNSCNFCILIYDAIAANDPFNHPAVKDHLPSKLADLTFRQWAEGMGWLEKAVYKSSYPFGRSKDKIDIQQNIQGEEIVVQATSNQDQLISDDAAMGASVATVGAYNAALWSETDQERVKMMATVGTVIPSKSFPQTSKRVQLTTPSCYILDGKPRREIASRCFHNHTQCQRCRRRATQR
jgi:hypothetical protein